MKEEADWVEVGNDAGARLTMAKKKDYKMFVRT